MGVAGFSVMLTLFFESAVVISKSIVIIVLMLSVMYRRYGKYGFVDPLGTLALAFMMYHGLFLLSVGLQGTSALQTTYPIIFSPQVFSDAANLSLAAAIGIFLAAFIGSRPAVRRSNSARSPLDTSPAPLIAGCICLLIGGIFTYLDFKQRGGFGAVLVMGRENRYLSADFEGFSWPFGAFIAAGLAWLAVAQATWRTRTRVAIFRITFLFFGLLFLVLGDRRPVVQATISALAASAAFAPEVARVTKRKLVFALLAYSLMSFYATFRGQIPSLVTGAITTNDVMTSIHDSELFVSMKPEKTDAAGPYFSIIDSITSDKPLRLGLTYVNALPTIVPGILWPIRKPQSLAVEFADSAHASFYSTSTEEAGWGFSPVAEAFQNFGLIGVPIVFFVVTKGFNWLCRLRNGSSLQVVMFAVVCAQALNFNRIDFMSFYDEAVYGCGAALVGYLLAKSVTGAIRKPPRALT